MFTHLVKVQVDEFHSAWRGNGKPYHILECRIMGLRLEWNLLGCEVTCQEDTGRGGRSATSLAQVDTGGWPRSDMVEELASHTMWNDGHSPIVCPEWSKNRCIQIQAKLYNLEGRQRIVNLKWPTQSQSRERMTQSWLRRIQFWIVQDMKLSVVKFKLMIMLEEVGSCTGLELLNFEAAGHQLESAHLYFLSWVEVRWWEGEMRGGRTNRYQTSKLGIHGKVVHSVRGWPPLSLSCGHKTGQQWVIMEVVLMQRGGTSVIDIREVVVYDRIRCRRSLMFAP